MENILATYDFVAPVEIVPWSEKGGNERNNTLFTIHAGEQEFVWKTYTSHSYAHLASLEYEYRIVHDLTQVSLSFAVPYPLPNRYGEILHHTADGWAVLLPRFPGILLNPDCPQEIFMFGQVLGELHEVMRAFPIAPRPGHHLFATFFEFPFPDHNVFTLTPQQFGLSEDSRHTALFRWWHEEAEYLHNFISTTYHVLPQSICHNDVAPHNILVASGRISALLDFEFITPAARALDVAMGLRMVMQPWKTPEPWKVLQTFLQGYTPWVRLTDQEIAALPLLFRLRSVMGILLHLGRQYHLERIPTLLSDKYETTQWLEHHTTQFLDTISQTIENIVAKNA